MMLINRGSLSRKVDYIPTNPPLESRVDVALILGQSNIDGRNNIIDLPVNNPSDAVKFYWGAKWWDWDATRPPVMYTVSQAYSADTIMLNRLAAHLNRTVYACKKSRGGTAFKKTNLTNGDWNINSWESFDHYHPFMRRIRNIKNFIEQIEEKTFNPIFLWTDIGEDDSSKSTKTQFKIDYTNFIQEVRNLVNNQNLPIVHRKLQLDQAGVTQWMLDAQEEFTTEINNYHLIRGNYTLFDSAHLSAESTEVYAGDVLELVKSWYR